MARAGSRTAFPRLAAPSLLALLVPLASLACSGEPADNGDGDSPLVPFPPAGQGGSGSVDNSSGAPGSQGGSGSSEPNYDPIGISGGSNSPPPGGSGTAGAQDPGDPGPTETPVLENVLVFSRTAGYRHDAIGPGIEAIRGLGASNGFAVEASEEPSIFNDAELGEFDVVIWLSTTGDVLNADQQAAFERYIRAGGSWVGVHAASDTEYDWAWYGQLLGGGAYFISHPAIQTVTLNVEQASHASTAHLPASFQLQDEWYNFRVNPRPSVNVLMTLDEASYQPGDNAMGADHPIAWYHEFDGGRAWYTALGHRQELYQDAMFTGHLLGGIRWAAGVVP